MGLERGEDGPRQQMKSLSTAIAGPKYYHSLEVESLAEKVTVRAWYERCKCWQMVPLTAVGHGLTMEE